MSSPHQSPQEDLPITPVPADLLVSVRALVRSAYIFRGVLTEAARGRPVDDLLDQHEELLEAANRVLERWVEHVGLGADQEGPGEDEAGA